MTCQRELYRCAAAITLLFAVDARAEPAPTSAPTTVGTTTVGIPVKTTAPRDEPAASRRVARRLDESKLMACRRQLRDEPSVRRLQRAALRYAKVDGATVDAALSRARTRGLLPRLNVGALYRADSSDSRVLMTDALYKTLDPKIDERGTIDGSRLWVGGMLTFDFGTLAGGPEQLAAVRVATYRNSLLEQVSRLYFERRRLQLELCAGLKLTTRQKLRLQLRLQQVSSVLDGLGNGALSRRVRSTR